MLKRIIKQHLTTVGTIMTMSSLDQNHKTRCARTWTTNALFHGKKKKKEKKKNSEDVWCEFLDSSSSLVCSYVSTQTHLTKVDHWGMISSHIKKKERENQLS